jgi:hypothetical protein
MQRALCWSVILMAGTLGVRPAAFGQAASIPLSLEVTASRTEVVVGESAQLVVKLKSYKGDTLPANEPITVSLHSELSGDASITFHPGQISADATVRFPRAGVATIVATAPKMSSGSVAVVVKAQPTPAVSVEPPPPPMAGGGGRPPSAAAAPELSGTTSHRVRPGANAAADLPATLAVDVLPQHVHPANALWRAVVLVTSINETRQPIAVAADTPVHLATDIGLVTPTFSQINAGKARTGEIVVTAGRAGSGTLWAWTDAGQLTAATVEYHDAVPTQLLVKALPSRAVNDGRTGVRVTVFLQDESAATASADHDIIVNLTSSIGSPTPSEVLIPKGRFFGEAIVTSPVAGKAEITATSARMKPGSAMTEFVFPFLLVVLAATGGLIGSVVRSGRMLLTGAWWWHIAGSVGLGMVLGLVFYALAMFGIIASIPKLSIPLAQLPTTNDLGALLLGFFGGYYARSWLPDPADGLRLSRRPAARKPRPRAAG